MSSNKDKKGLNTVRNNLGLKKRMDVHAAQNYPDESGLIIGAKDSGLKSAEGTLSVVGDEIPLTDEAIDLYNSSIATLDPMYSDLKFYRGILVRLLHRKPSISKGGVIQFEDQEVVVGTKAKGFVKRVQKSIFQLDRVGIIVSVAESFGQLFKVGDWVQVHQNVVTPYKPTDEHRETLELGFIHYQSKMVAPPSVPSSRHFGYFLLNDPMQFIECGIQDPDKEYPELDTVPEPKAKKNDGKAATKKSTAAK